MKYTFSSMFPSSLRRSRRTGMEGAGRPVVESRTWVVIGSRSWSWVDVGLGVVVAGDIVCEVDFSSPDSCDGDAIVSLTG